MVINCFLDRFVWIKKVDFNVFWLFDKLLKKLFKVLLIGIYFELKFRLDNFGIRLINVKNESNILIVSLIYVILVVLFKKVYENKGLLFEIIVNI